MNPTAVEPAAFQGLFYFAVCACAFLAMMLIQYVLGARRARLALGVGKVVDDDWIDREPLRIAEIITESHDVKTFKFRRANGKPFPPFLPGQFFSFQIGDDPKNLRSYSIASSSENRATVAVAIKRLKDGVGSCWFHALKVGDTVKAFPPSGHFTDASLGSEPRVFIAGGIGITPFLSMIHTAIDQGRTQSIQLFYGMRTSEDLVYHAHLSLLSTRHPWLKYHPVLSSVSDPSWSGMTGFITAALLGKHVKDVGNAHYFFCGPTPMTDAITADLAAKAVAEDRVHIEKFASPTALDPESIPEREAKILYLGQQYDYKGRMTILEALEAKGLDLPYACRVGVCGSCKCVIKGKVHEITDAGLTPAERKQGVKLPCVAFPLENIELEA